jgi:hypothetical protein
MTGLCGRHLILFSSEMSVLRNCLVRMLLLTKKRKTFETKFAMYTQSRRHHNEFGKRLNSSQKCLGDWTRDQMGMELK